MQNRRTFLLTTTALVVGCRFQPQKEDLIEVGVLDPTAESFRAQFNKDSASPRLVMLVSSL